MSDPRNAAHDKKVSQQKKHNAESEPTAATPEASPAAAHHEGPATLEGSVTVLSHLKEMDFHSRATLERLAELMLTVGDDLKQKEFASQVGDIFSAQDAFQTKLAALIEPYQAEVTRMQDETS